MTMTGPVTMDSGKKSSTHAANMNDKGRERQQPQPQSQSQQQISATTSTSTASSHVSTSITSIYYLLPPDSYQYCHPEDTGKDLPPFYSSWFLFSGTIPQTEAKTWTGRLPSLSSSLSLLAVLSTPTTSTATATSVIKESKSRCCKVATTVDQLVSGAM